MENNNDDILSAVYRVIQERKANPTDSSYTASLMGKGIDKILKKMNRHTTKKDIIRLIEKLRKNIPGIALRTSVIIGFPGETEADFQETLSLAQEVGFAQGYVFK